MPLYDGGNEFGCSDLLDMTCLHRPDGRDLAYSWSNVNKVWRLTLPGSNSGDTNNPLSTCDVGLAEFDLRQLVKRLKCDYSPSLRTCRMPDNAPVFGKFDQDPRVHFDKIAGKWQYEDEDTEQEYEWTGQIWIPLVCTKDICERHIHISDQVDEELWKAQQAAYSVEGVDESVSIPKSQ